MRKSSPQAPSPTVPPPPDPAAADGPDESTAAAPAADMYARWRITWRLPPWLAANPALAFTLGYLLLTVIGVAYTWALYRRFGVNVLDYAETTDFLVAVAREPLVILAVLAPIPVYMLYMSATARTSRWLRRRWKRFDRWSVEAERRYTARPTPMVPATKALFIAVYAFLFITLQSGWQAARLRRDDARQVAVEFKTGSWREGESTWTGTVIGTTTRFVFIYDREHWRVEAVPLDAVARLRFAPRVPRYLRDEVTLPDAAGAAPAGAGSATGAAPRP